MGGVLHTAVIVSDRDIGVMILSVRDPRDRVDECHRLVIILKVVSPPNPLFEEFPTLNLWQKGCNLVGTEWWDTALTGLALLGSKIADGIIHVGSYKSFRISDEPTSEGGQSLKKRADESHRMLSVGGLA